MHPGETGVSPSETPLVDLVTKLSRDGSLLVQQEIALAKAELGEKADKLKVDVAAIALGAVVLYAGLLTLIAGSVLLLAELIPAWVAALAIGALVAAVGAVLTLKGKKNLETLSLTPEKTISSLERDVQVIKEAIR